MELTNSNKHVLDLCLTIAYLQVFDSYCILLPKTKFATLFGFPQKRLRSRTLAVSMQESPTSLWGLVAASLLFEQSNSTKDHDKTKVFIKKKGFLGPKPGLRGSIGA